MIRSSKKFLGLFLCSALIIGSISSKNAFKKVNAENTMKAKNIIMLIPDGMSVEASTLARWYKDSMDEKFGNDSLTLDEIAVGQVRTHWNKGPITDSAPAGTAYSTGHKSDDGRVGLLGADEGSKPVATILEAAKSKGKATGLIATCEIPHATPADFASHSIKRSQYNVIAKQLVHSEIDVVLGGGFKPADKTYPTGAIDTLMAKIQKDYTVVKNKADMEASTAAKLWGIFADADMAYEIDRPSTKPEQPTLAEMTKKAISILSKDPDGFFLMVEGSKIDWAAHANDAIAVAADVIAFDNAVKEALDFAKKDGSTVVIAAADHGTGGLTVGSNAVSSYSTASFADTVGKLKNSKASLDIVKPQLNGADETKVKEVIKTCYDITLTDAEAKNIKDEISGVKEKAGSLVSIVSKPSNTGWSTGGHVGGDIALYAYAPGNMEFLEGVVDNAEIGKYMARVLGVDLNTVTSSLFVDAKAAYEAKGAVFEIDEKDTNSPVITVTKGSDVLKINVYTNIAVLNGVESELNGISVYGDKTVYVPKQAVDMIK